MKTLSIIGLYNIDAGLYLKIYRPITFDIELKEEDGIEFYSLYCWDISLHLTCGLFEVEHILDYIADELFEVYINHCYEDDDKLDSRGLKIKRYLDKRVTHILHIDKKLG